MNIETNEKHSTAVVVSVCKSSDLDLSCVWSDVLHEIASCGSDCYVPVLLLPADHCCGWDCSWSVGIQQQGWAGEVCGEQCQVNSAGWVRICGYTHTNIWCYSERGTYILYPDHIALVGATWIWVCKSIKDLGISPWCYSAIFILGVCGVCQM